MTRAEKTATIEALKEKLSGIDHFYLADSSTLTVEQVNKFRRLCFEKGIEMKVVKNTLVQKALESAPEEKNFAGLYEALKGPTALLIAEKANAPAKLIKEFRKDFDKPTLKAAYIDTDVFLGDDKLDALANLKSKEDLVAEIIALLQSPAKNVVGALQSGGQTLMGILKTLEERSE
ncbi:MAG: 50S ribosomal protein L10 [Phaeodactylibacter sp.]|nr:50S ribosomal protein L10 [Phaeodactylibacter sp.]MCB9292404.1 50S ribosomal protein L10 [Lewinellaceae bacterium]